ncbi:sigma 54-interacting transcriptional regulator [Shewanella sp. 5_MG-2023]|uniref:sigma-54 interaction domain-containing protein n=1 Tax=Shewanella sp. 5_MG-2023 TaxID=3062656 RepID=UPI0026E235BC|nr:sigma 54-interacting transcriptional regulator [Shewanella sp. 5_MG-2023]MDO6639544.1 sigma 54-interacting transcriptional regulator [Shewanella sp. 5_MG-2023]
MNKPHSVNVSAHASVSPSSSTSSSINSSISSSTSSSIGQNVSPDIKSSHFLPENTLLLSAITEGVYGFDLDGNAVFINPAAEKMTGWKSEELIGNNIHDCHHHSHADGRHYPREDCPIYRTLHDGVARQVSEDVFWRKDGSCFPVYYSSTPVYDHGVLIGVIAIFRDVSIQKHTENSLREALAQVQALSERLASENQYLLTELQGKQGATGLSGSSQAIKHLTQQISLVANTDSTVLICGENGTGKELVARSLHQLSHRKDQPMVSVNCAAFSASILESELFGHEKGAFTGATSRRKGRFELAHNGTLFLDEIAELSLEAQSKLLRVIQEQTFERVGSSESIKVNIRLIAATHHDLQARVEQGLFRMDLYYRLNVFPILVPPLRDRSEDLAELVSDLVGSLSQKLGKKITKVSAKGFKKLQHYTWPGNVRELQNLIEREIILTQNDTLDFNSLNLNPLNTSKVTANSGLTSQAKQVMTLAQAEAAHIGDVLAQTQWRISGVNGAANLLGLPPSTLRSRMKKLSITR